MTETDPFRAVAGPATGPPSSPSPRILVVGTADTKPDELRYLARCIARLGGEPSVMDVGVLDGAPFAVDIPNHRVAQAAGTTLAAIAGLGDENAAMAEMARGASALTRRRWADGQLDGVLLLGGTMGTDLALDVAASLPLGVPKVVLSTVSFSPLIPPERISPDLTMVLWAGGLYGLNPICEGALQQACGAVVGAARAREPAHDPRPLVAISSLGRSCLSYMVRLKPALEARGYGVAVFHCTGMGGRAMEGLAAEGRFVAVLDLCMQELCNEVNGSVVSAGPDRLRGAGRAGVPQIVAPGASDMFDLPAWQPLPPKYEGRPYHAHNRLIGSVVLTPDERRAVALAIGERLREARGPTAFVLPLGGIEQWDRPGEPLNDPAGLAAFVAGAREAIPGRIELDAHINDSAFSDAVMAVFDAWVDQGKIPRP